MSALTALFSSPIIQAAGGRIAAVPAAGASAAHPGTAFTARPESGAHRLDKQAPAGPPLPRAGLARAFGGRPARGPVNRFMREHGGYAPAADPQVPHPSALRPAAAAAGDRQAMAQRTGQAHRPARALPAARLAAVLPAEPESACPAAAGS